MNRYVAVAGGVLAGAALLGVGVAVGSQVGEQQALVMAADAKGPLNSKDMMLLQTFITASNDFDKLAVKARKSKNAQEIGTAMTQQGVIVLAVERNAEGEKLRTTADAVADAMLLIGAGVTVDDGGAVQDGLEQYKIAQQKVVELTTELNESMAQESGDQPQPAETQAP